MLAAPGHPPVPVVLCVFGAANVVIMCGYAVLAGYGIRYVRLARTRRSKLALGYAAGFFGGCVGTHLMVLSMPHTSWFWLAWHVVQAVCTWGAIIVGRSIVRDAHLLWTGWAREAEEAKQAAAGGGTDGTATA